MQNEILEANPGAELTVFAVWFNMLASDSRSGWSRGLLTDPRVVHLWDGEQILGRWMAEHPALGSRGLVGGGVMWDTYLLFGPEARWSEDGPAPLGGAGHTIVRAREQLRGELSALLVPAGVP